MPKDRNNKSLPNRLVDPYVDRNFAVDPSHFSRSGNQSHAGRNTHKPLQKVRNDTTRNNISKSRNALNTKKPNINANGVTKEGIVTTCPSIKNTNQYIEKITIQPKRPKNSRGAEFGRLEEAWFLLHKIASMVFPIMRSHGFRVKHLTEFYRADLLGRNFNHGAKIELRIRRNDNPNEFLPLHSLLGTMLHELTHNKIGPHNDSFNKYMRGMVNELETMMANGFTGSGFFSVGKRLGGVPNDRNHSRFAVSSPDVDTAFKNSRGKRLGTSNSVTGHRLGEANSRNQNGKMSIKNAILDALDRRLPTVTVKKPGQLPGSSVDTPLMFGTDLDELRNLDDNDLRIIDINTQPEDYANIKIEIQNIENDNFGDVEITNVVEKGTHGLETQSQVIDLTND